MKKLILSILVLLMVTNVVAAEEASQSVEDNKAVIAIEKQPTNKSNKQAVKNNWFSIVIVVNGKVKDTGNNSTTK